MQDAAILEVHPGLTGQGLDSATAEELATAIRGQGGPYGYAITQKHFAAQGIESAGEDIAAREKAKKLFDGWSHVISTAESLATPRYEEAVVNQVGTAEITDSAKGDGGATLTVFLPDIRRTGGVAQGPFTSEDQRNALLAAGYEVFELRANPPTQSEAGPPGLPPVF
jgi:hypothetical protein